MCACVFVSIWPWEVQIWQMVELKGSSKNLNLSCDKGNGAFSWPNWVLTLGLRWCQYILAALSKVWHFSFEFSFSLSKTKDLKKNQ